MKDPTHMQGHPEWIAFNKERLETSARTLTRMMSEAGLLPAAQERLRKIFQFATNPSAFKGAIKVEMQLQERAL